MIYFQTYILYYIPNKMRLLCSPDGAYEPKGTVAQIILFGIEYTGQYYYYYDYRI